MDLDSDDFFDPRIRNVSLGRPDVDRGHGPENQRSLCRGKSSPKLDGNRSEPKPVFRKRPHPEEKLSLPSILVSWNSTVPKMFMMLFLL